jgi:7-cyano-7-deazaguanine synthase
MKPKAFVLLSGGIDSTVCLYEARYTFGSNVEAVSIYYGQRHMKEIEYARKSAGALDIPHRIVNLASIVPKTMLTDVMAKIPEVSYAEIPGVSPTYVPFRNGLLLSAVASIVHGEYVKESEYGDNALTEMPLPEWAIYFGAHAEDAQNWAYPDCTPEFLGAMANAIYIGTYRAIRLHTPLQWDTKRDIILKGEQLGVDWRRTWSCYAGKTLHCGVCPTCRARRAGFKAAMIQDPTEYEVTKEEAPP